MVIGFDGSVRLANAGACRMFGLRPEEVVGRRFGEVFIEFEGFDEVTQMVLDAVQSRSGVERRVTSVRSGDAVRSLSVTTSYLTAAREGGPAPVAVIAVLADITEVRELRETALRRAKMALDNEERQLRRTTFLLEQGLIPASEHEEARERHESRKLDFEAARRELEAAKAKGGGGSRRRNTPQFEIMVALDRLDAADRDRLRVGMSAHVTIVVLDRPAALLVPIDAVEQRDSAMWVRVIDRDTAAVEERAVTLGLTTLDSVEVVEGIEAGEEIVLSRS